MFGHLSSKAFSWAFVFPFLEGGEGGGVTLFCVYLFGHLSREVQKPNVALLLAAMGQQSQTLCDVTAI